MDPYYQDDHVTIYHGDCLDILPQIEGLSAEMVMADPPYSLSVERDHENRPGRGTRRLDFFDGDRDWDEMTAYVLKRIRLALECDVLSTYVWCGHRQFGPIVDMLESGQWKTRPVVWQKACPVPAPPGVGWDSAVELCVYGFRPGREWTPPTGTKVPNFISADSYRHGQPGKVDHPTQKPMATAILPIERSTRPGQTVLDPFMGSGTTLRAAKDLGRKAIGIEISERYCEVAARRMGQEVLPLGV